MKQLITHAELLAGYKYNPATGIFLNLKTGKRIGFYDKSCNKRKINIGDKNYAETRLAVFYVTGKWPAGFVKSKSNRKAYNTKFRDLIYALPKEEYLTATICGSNGVVHKLNGIGITRNEAPKKPTWFQRFLSIFPRI